MRSATFRILGDNRERTLVLSGDWTSLTLGDMAMRLRSELGGGATALDLAELGRMDTAGAYVVLDAAGPTIAPDASMRPDVARLFELVRPAMSGDAAPPPRMSWLHALLDRVGRAIVDFGHEAKFAAEFFGRLVLALIRTARSPRRLRVVSVTHAMETAGTSALPIIIIMNLFIGAVVALVGTNLLSSLGVAVFTVQLVGVAVLREFAVLITAILLAGRSASSFAAQIGSMKMAQETDAMQVMGVDQIDALVVPRVLALLWMMPLLTFAAMVAGITGGLIVSWATLDISPVFFLERLRDTVSIRHFWVGMSKTPLLAILIAMAGCRHGLSVGGDVESLGSRVTMAVVQAIFMTILFDAVFAIIYMELKL
ncbi:ABC transporter permease [Sphingomonas sp. LaA6.9]|uniref:ABC transporter permease n=1 Tax=Sphingomonas sp. LaA6.9 TaxID=2919914 RepID=UPI001F4F74B3|nr:ABC transporter permease [Sphingomonas sp. LaA6.9]MCJ8157129.1 ABC transporter permease [Sphingomonas sp. LaA6.9]